MHEGIEAIHGGEGYAVKNCTACNSHAFCRNLILLRPV